MPIANKIIINQKVLRDITDNAAAKIALIPARNLAKEIVNQRKEQFLDEFDNHEVSQEINAGAEPNFGVGSANGNLFSFLGFNAGSDPVGDLRSYLNKKILLGPTYTYNKGTKTYTFKIFFPTLDEIKSVTDLGNYTNDEFGSGRSWAISIERGIPGLNRYKYSTNPDELGGDSRSGTGLQRRNVLRGDTYKTRKYISELLKILYSV